MTQEEINTKYKEYHDNLTTKFKSGLTFKGVTLSQGEFDKLHSLNWLNHEKDLVTEGYTDAFPMGARELSEINSAITTETNRVVKDISNNDSTITYNVTDR